MTSRRLASPRRRMVGLALLAVTASAPVAITTTPALAQSTASSAASDLGRFVADAARRFAIPEAWIWAVMSAESNGDIRAVSPVGAMGLMQIMPDTWAGLRVRHGLGADPFDPRDNIQAGAAYLREMHDRYGDVIAMLAAYNAGPGRTDEYLSRGRPLPAVTRAYIAKLASITSGSSDTQLAAAPPLDPFAWRTAALFPARSDAASPVPVLSPERPSTEPAPVAMASMTPHQAGLFVPVSGQPAR